MAKGCLAAIWVIWALCGLVVLMFWLVYLGATDLSPSSKSLILCIAGTIVVGGWGYGLLRVTDRICRRSSAGK